MLFVFSQCPFLPVQPHPGVCCCHFLRSVGCFCFCSFDDAVNCQGFSFFLLLHVSMTFLCVYECFINALGQWSTFGYAF